MLLALDAGSSKIALVAYDPEGHRTIASRTVAVDARLDSEPGESLWDASRFWQLIVQLLADLSKDIDVHSCKGLAVTGQQHGMVLLDRNTMRICSPFIGWMDGRGRRKETDGRTLEEVIQHRLAAVCSGELGCRMATGYAGLTLFDLNRKGMIPTNTVMVFLTDYINRELCGLKMPVTDPTMAASSGLFDVQKTQWSEAGLNELGLSRSLFPDVVPSGSRLGCLSEEVAAATGLPVGLPVYQGWGDNQASILGGLTACPHSLDSAIPVVINYGTGTQVTVISNEFQTSSDFETRPFLDGKFLWVRAEPSGGRAWSLLRDFFIQAGRDLFDITVDSEQMYERMNRMANEGNDPEMICRPRFYPGRHRHVSEDEQGTFTHIDANHFTPGEMIRSLLTGMANESFEHWQILARALKTKVNKSPLLLGSGNLFRKNTAFRKFVEKRFGLPIHLPEIQEEAAIGTALLMLKQGIPTSNPARKSGDDEVITTRSPLTSHFTERNRQ